MDDLGNQHGTYSSRQQCRYLGMHYPRQSPERKQLNVKLSLACFSM